MLTRLSGFVARIVVSFLARIFKDWRRDGDLRDLGAAQQSNKEAVELEKRGRESDDIEARIETATDEELDKMMERKK